MYAIRSYYGVADEMVEPGRRAENPGGLGDQVGAERETRAETGHHVEAFAFQVFDVSRVGRKTAWRPFQ